LKLIERTNRLDRGEQARRDGPKTQTGIETQRPVLDQVVAAGVATDRKPRPGLKRGVPASRYVDRFGRDGPKTQTGIETHRPLE